MSTKRRNTGVLTAACFQYENSNAKKHISPLTRSAYFQIEKHQVETSKPPGKPCYTAITPAETRAEINLLYYGYEIPIMSQDRPKKSTNDSFTIYNVNVVK
jgi:hypothetical protein